MLQAEITVCTKARRQEIGALGKLELGVPAETGKAGGASSGRILAREDLGNKPPRVLAWWPL